MKTILIFVIIFIDVNVKAQIIHPTCKLWVPTWKPQGHLYVYKAELLSRKLKLNGYDVRFGNSRTEKSDLEIFLDVKEKIIKKSNVFQKGKAILTLKLRDLDPNLAIKTIYSDDTSVKCSVHHSADPSAYKEYTRECTRQLTKRVEALPRCIKL